MRWYLGCLLALTMHASLSAAPTDFRVGVAKTVITPGEPTWLSGYSSRTRPADGKIHDLYAKAIAFESADGTRLVWVTLDLGSVSPELTESVAKNLERKHQLPRGSLVLNCSHTHCAPEIAAERLVFHAMPDEAEKVLVRYIEQLKVKLTDLVGTALKDLQPATLGFSSAEAGFGYNRRLPTERGFVNSQNKEGVTDRQVPVLRVVGADGKLRAVVFGYACHNTTLAFQQYCGDYAGFAQYAIEDAHPGTIALFMMGCGGDQNPYPRHGPMALEFARLHGGELAAAVEKALRAEPKPVRGPLRVGYTVATLELQPLPEWTTIEAQSRGPASLAQRKAAYLLAEKKRNGKIDLTQRCPLHAARFGDDLLYIAISGETVIDYTLRCKKDFAGPNVWVAGYCDDVFAYLPSQRVLREGGYEGREGIIHQLTPAPFADDVEDRVMAGIRTAVEMTRK